MANPTTITRSLYRRSGDKYPRHLELFSEPISITDPNSVLIRVHAVSLNYRDINIIRGTNPWDVKLDGVPVSDAAGEVIAVGDKVSRFKIGDKVCPTLDQKNITGTEMEREWLGGDGEGVLATHVVFPEKGVARFPDHLSWAEAACLPCAGVTAWSGLNDGKMTAETSVLLQGTGGVSIFAHKLAQQVGASILLTSSSDYKLARGQSLSTKPITLVNYRTQPNWETIALTATDARGVDIVIENGGNQSLMQSLRAVRKRGTVSAIGYLGEQKLEHLEGMLPLLIDKAINLRGINVGSRLDFEDLNAFVAKHQMKFDDIIDRIFSFEDSAKAFEYLASGAHFGKVIIEIP